MIIINVPATLFLPMVPLKKYSMVPLKQSLIGKLLTEKIIPKQIVQNTLLGIWGFPKPLQFQDRIFIAPGWPC
jgi:hypothetical protein